MSQTAASFAGHFEALVAGFKDIRRCCSNCVGTAAVMLELAESAHLAKCVWLIAAVVAVVWCASPHLFRAV